MVPLLSPTATVRLSAPRSVAIGCTLSPVPSMSGDPGRVPLTAPSASSYLSGLTPQEPRACRRQGAVQQRVELDWPRNRSAPDQPLNFPLSI